MGGRPASLASRRQCLSSGPDPVPVPRAHLTLYVVLISMAGLVMLAARGLLGGATLTMTLPLAVPFFAGVLLGARLFARFSDLRFRQFTLVLLLVVSVGILLA